MKRLLLFCVCLLCAGLLAQNDIWNLNPVQTEARKLLSARTTAQPGQAFDLQQLKELHRSIVGNRRNVWAMPEPMLRGIQDALEPLRSQAKELAESALPDERYYGAILNSYLKQTDETRALLLKLAHDGQAETAGTALDTLFGLKLDTPELRAEIVQELQKEVPPRERSTIHSLARNRAGRWNLSEAIPELIAIAEKTYEREKRIDGVVVQLKLLGPAAEQALPTLRDLLEKRKADGDAPFREIEALEFAIRSVSGEFKAPVQYVPTQSQSGSAQSESPVPSFDLGQHPSVQIGEPSAPKSWPVLLLAGLVVVALCLVWAFLRKRN